MPSAFAPGQLSSLTLENLNALARICPNGSERWRQVQAEIGQRTGRPAMELETRIRGDASAGNPNTGAGSVPRNAGAGVALREKDVEAEIDRALQQLGFRVTRLSQARRTNQTPGVPDRYAQHERWGMRVWVEVKAGDNGPSRHQVAWHAAERAAGGMVVIAWSVADLHRELRALGAPI